MKKAQISWSMVRWIVIFSVVLILIIGGIPLINTLSSSFAGIFKVDQKAKGDFEVIQNHLKDSQFSLAQSKLETFLKDNPESVFSREAQIAFIGLKAKECLEAQCTGMVIIPVVDGVKEIEIEMWFRQYSLSVPIHYPFSSGTVSGKSLYFDFFKEHSQHLSQNNFVWIRNE